MSNENFIWRFSPSRTAPELLEAIFVQRESLLQDLLERVAESATTGSKHHVLLIGPRGFGKTHLITLLNHRLSNDSSLTDRIRVAWLLEDETITSFVQLLKRIYEILAQQHPGDFPLKWLQELLDESPRQIQRQLQDRLIEAFRDRTLLLCIENLDVLFNGLGADGQHEWRAFLWEHPFTTIMASTQRLFEDVKSREKPFFGFFSPIHLDPLSVDDAVELLRRVALNRSASELVSFLDSADGRSRVRALHHLAGGNHRIYVALSSFITRESLDDFIGPFQRLADELTPHYQERLRWLSPQQRQIVEYLCSQDRPCMPKQIARHLMAAENSVSSQLKKLLETGYLLRSERGRESLYELAEPLMRLASEVKEQKPRRPLQVLLKFLRVWYCPEDRTRFTLQTGADTDHGAALKTDIDGRDFVTADVKTIREFGLRYAHPADIEMIGASLLRRLARFDMEKVTPTSLYKWRDSWVEFGSQYPEFQVPLRLLGVGIEYLIKQDRRVLLDLIVIERQILEQALEIEVSTDSV